MTPSCRNLGYDLARALPKRTLTLGLGVFLAFAALAGAQTRTDRLPPDSQPSSGTHLYPTRDVQRDLAKLILKAETNLTYHGGPIITSAHVVFIFWGPSFNNAASPDYNYARTLQSFRNQLGTTPEYNTITQYSGYNGTIALTNLAAGTADWFDTSMPPTDVTVAIARGEVNTYLSTHAFDDNAIYEVVLPTTSYSSYIFPSGTTFTSCGGPNPGFCAYHGYYASGANVVKYSVQPYPNCSDCQVPGWSAVQNQEKLVTHETREAVTDPQINAWLDANGDEADDKCRHLTFFGTGGYGYQQEWSNAASGCVTSTPIGPPPPPPPVANFTFVCTGFTCTFDGTGSTGTGLTYSWAFGDGSYGFGATVSHTYPTIAGISDYWMDMTVTDSLGQQSTKAKGLSVTNDPVVAAPNYFVVAPCRVLDTRNTTVLTKGQSRVVNIAGLCGVPSTAKAVSLNVTAVSPTGSGKIRLYPGDLTVLWSGAKRSLYFAPATSPRANSAVVELAHNGAGTLGIYPEVAGSPGGQVHLILDVQGYFSSDTTPAPGAQGPLGFQTLVPCRIADTRPSNTPIATGTVRTFTAQGVCGVPAGAAVASLHVGVPAPTASGFISLYPSNISFPGTSTINFQSGISDLHNGALLRLSPTTPDLAAFFGGAVGTTAHTYFDVNGYFKSNAPLKYHPITPCQSVNGAFLRTDTVSRFQIQGNCGVPVGAKAALLHLMVTLPTSSGELTVYPSNLPLSGVAVSTVKFGANEPGLSMSTIVPLSTLADDLAASPGQMTAGGTLVLSIDVFGYFQ